MYALGIDCGGTKTAFLLADAKGQIVAQTTTRGAGMGDPSDFTAMLREARDTLLAEAGITVAEIGALCGGILGFGESTKWEEYCHATLQELYPQAKLNLVNDVLIGIYGSLGMESGIHIISGTGSIAFGADYATGREARSGGWADFSDEGSGAWLGKQAMEYFYKELDGRLQRGALYDIYVKHFDLQEPIELDMLDKYRLHYAGKRHEIGKLQLLLLQAYRQGDPAAVDLYDQAAWHLALLARGVYNQLQGEKSVQTIKVSYSGGLFKTGDVILTPLKKHLSDLNVAVCTPLLEPVYGALLFALTMAGMTREEALPCLLAQK